jgi:hypothetical protein
MHNLTAQLDFLIEHYAKIEPEMAHSFLPGLKPDEVINTFKRINLSPSKEIVELYGYFNGQLSYSSFNPEFGLSIQEDRIRIPNSALKDKYFYDGAGDGFFPYFSYLLPIEEGMHHYYDTVHGLIPEKSDFDSHLFPILFNELDELLHLVNLRDSSVYVLELYQECEEPNLMYKDISTMLQTLIELYTSPVEDTNCYIFKSKVFQNIWLKNNQEIGEQAISKIVKHRFTYCY